MAPPPANSKAADAAAAADAELGRRQPLLGRRLAKIALLLATAFLVFQLDCRRPLAADSQRQAQTENSPASVELQETPRPVQKQQDSNQWLLFGQASQSSPDDKRNSLGELSLDESPGAELDQAGRSSPFMFEAELGEQRPETTRNKSRIKSFSAAAVGEFASDTTGGANDKQASRRRRAARISMRFVLMCQVLDGEPPIQIKWFKDNAELATSGGSGGAGAASSANLQLVSVAAGDQQQPAPAASNGHRTASGKLDDQVELVSSDELGSSLLFRKIRQQHGGNYTCLATNRYGSASYSSIMSVKVPPNWRIEPQDRESVMGEQITIDCQAWGNPNPFIRWKFTSVQLHELQQQQQGSADGADLNGIPTHANNFKLINSNHQVQTLENGSLSIRQASKEHEGFYLCEADNGVEPSLVKAIRLIVHLQAHFRDDIQVLLAVNGGGGGGGGAGATTANQLMMSRPPDTGGAVSGSASAPAVAAAAAAAAAGSTPPGAIKLVRLPQNASLVRLVCSPFGDAPLQLDWLKDGHLIYSHSGANDNRPSAVAAAADDDNQSPPAIEQLDSSATGAPFARMSPVAGLSASTSVGRYHVSSRRIEPGPLAPQSGAPATARHYKQQQQQPVAGAAGGLESELILATLVRQDAGLYTCLARNAHGQAERKLRLVVQEQPDPPSMIDVAHVSSRSIGLRWLSPFDGNSPILKYIIEYRRQTFTEQQQHHHQQQQQQLLLTPQHSSGKLSESEAPASRSEKLVHAQAVAGGVAAKEGLATGPLVQRGLPFGASNEPQLADGYEAAQQQQQQQTIQHTIHDLEPLTRYSIRIIAVNALGQSKPSVALSLRTEEEVPSTVPSSVEATVLGSKSIKLHWTISYPLEHELIDGFFVGYRSFDTSALLAGEPTTSSTTIGADSSAANQQQQIASAKQSIERPTFTYKTIRLTNQQRTLQEEQQGPAAGGQQRGHLLQSTNDGLDASAPLLSPISSVTKTSPLVAKGVAGSQATGAASQPQTVIVVSNFEYVINGLERNTEYTILIQCFNKKGAGPTSDPVVFKTFSIDPPEKLNLVAEENSESSVRLSWHFPSEPPAAPVVHVPAYTRPGLAAHSFEPIDGFVLTFAKIAPKSKHLQRGDLFASDQEPPAKEPASVQKPDSAARISHPILLPGASSNYHQLAGANSSHLQLLNAANSIKQWHAIQLAPQQRTHLLKNLECGSWYAMKILAFNKVGKGEPSDLVTVGTRGKAPVAPDRRSFLSINSTQVRLHLSAWYDGGCDIDKFIIQYRARNQQQEWILVSNNVLREQGSILIKDLQPATAYETLVGAQNQVGLTEVKYRFVTLDSDGKQVSSGSSTSFLSGSPFGGAPDDEDNVVVYYSDTGTGDPSSGAGARREIWSSASVSPLGGRWLFVIKQILNSPLTLLLAFCLFVVLLILLVVNRLNSQKGPSGGSTTSTTTLNSSSGGGGGAGGKLNSGACGGGGGGGLDASGGSICTSLTNHHHHHLQAGNYHHYRQCSADGIDCDGPAMSLANDCSTNTPPLTETSPSHVNLPPVDRVLQHSQAPSSGNGDYATRLDCFGGNASYGCGLPMSQSAAAAVGPVATTRSFNPGEHYTAASSQPTYYAQANGAAHLDSHYASVQRSATMEAANNLTAAASHHDHPDGQQCLMQMLMMAPQQQQQQLQQQQQQLDQVVGQQQHQPFSYSAAALSTLANRHKSGTLRAPSAAAGAASGLGHQQSTGFTSMTLGRQQIHHYQTFQTPGKL